ncbi:MAG: transglutaminase-like domain-containing protein [Oscillospiraceae bacterium]
MDTRSYFAAQSSITDPGEYGSLFADMPKTAPEICGVIQGLFLDYAAWYTFPVGTERLLLTNDHYVSAILGNIMAMNKNPLTVARPVPERIFASASDYASLFCAIARYHGIPARKRVGYTPGEVYRSYDIAEYWDGSAWQQADPAGLLEGEFLSAAQAWQAWRKGEMAPEQFRGDPSKGVDILRAGLMLDLASVNKVELLDWDRYGWMLTPIDYLSDRAWAVLDEVAELLQNVDENLEALQAVYTREEGLEVPHAVECNHPLVPVHKFELVH